MEEPFGLKSYWRSAQLKQILADSTKDCILEEPRVLSSCLTSAEHMADAIISTSCSI